MTDFGFGVCGHCHNSAVVKVNNQPVCVEHLNEAFVGIGATVRAAREVFDGR